MEDQYGWGGEGYAHSNLQLCGTPSTSLRNRGGQKNQKHLKGHSLCWTYCMRESPACWSSTCSFWVTIAPWRKKTEDMVLPSAGSRLLQGFRLSRNWKPGTTLSKAKSCCLSATQGSQLLLASVVRVQVLTVAGEKICSMDAIWYVAAVCHYPTKAQGRLQPL